MEFKRQLEQGIEDQEKPSTSGCNEESQGMPAMEEVPSLEATEVRTPYAAELRKANKGTQKGLHRPICRSKGNLASTNKDINPLTSLSSRNTN